MAPLQKNDVTLTIMIIIRNLIYTYTQNSVVQVSQVYSSRVAAGVCQDVARWRAIAHNVKKHLTPPSPPRRLKLSTSATGP